MNESIEEFEKKFKTFLLKNNPENEGIAKKWTMRLDGKYGETGRAMYATTDIPANTSFLYESPMLIGPSALDSQQDVASDPFCAICFRHNTILKVCDRCGLRYCVNGCVCFDGSRHKNLCGKLNMAELTEKTGMSQEAWLVEIRKALTILKAILLDDEEMSIVQSLQQNTHENRTKIASIKQLGVELTDHEENILKIVYDATATNAYQTIKRLPNTTTVIGLGLYPIASLMNHNCMPNVTHLYDENNVMIVKTTRDIFKGEEITGSYTRLLWGTITRRHSLFLTKQFWCECVRCMNLNETERALNALYCSKDDCKGLIASVDPLRIASIWQCDECGNRMTAKAIGRVTFMMGKFFETLKEDDKLIKFVKNTLKDVLPDGNEVSVWLKQRVLWKLGYVEGFYWSDLTRQDLELKERINFEIMALIDTLNLNGIKLRGLLQQDYYLLLDEKLKRLMDSNGDAMEIGKITKKMTDLKTECVKALERDVELTIG